MSERKWYVTTKGARHSYARVVHTQECSYVPRATNAHVWTRNPLDEKDTSGLYPCERCKPQPSPKKIAAMKAELKVTQAAQATKQREHKDRVARMKEIFRCTRLWEEAKLEVDVITFALDGHRYEIKEID